jgi:hypothetical protein
LAILVALVFVLVMGAILLLIWATWFKSAPQIPIAPPDPMAQAVASVEPTEAEEPPTLDIREPLVIRATINQRSAVYFRNSRGEWISSRPEEDPLSEDTVRGLLHLNVAQIVPQAELNSMFRSLDESLAILNRDITRMSTDEIHNLTRQIHSQISNQFQMITQQVAMTTPVGAGGNGGRGGTTATGVGGPVASNTVTNIGAGGGSKAAAGSKTLTSRLDRLLSDDDLV